jgi:mono/diheme cytochrome c family protein
MTTPLTAGSRPRRPEWLGTRCGALLLVSLGLLATATGASRAAGLFSWRWSKSCAPACAAGDCATCPGPGGTWHWLRSPEEEQRVVISLYNRYCIRCHGVDGRGVWDIPDVPNFANPRWQSSRSDDQLVRAIIEGRGAVMPPFRGTLNLDEAWAMARYLRTFVPGTEQSRPDLGQPEKSSPAAK